MPLFSIITVCYNAGKTLGRTLESIDSQTCKNYEHIVVDGASSDGTLDVIAAHPNALRRHVSEPDKGLYDAMNKGMGLAKGKYLIFLNAGDKFHSPETLAAIAATAKAHGTPAIIYGDTDIVDMEGRYLGPRHLLAPAKLTLNSFAQGMLVCHQAFIPLKRITGFYSMKYRYSADYEWCIRCLHHARKTVKVEGESLVDYLNEGLTSSNRMASLLERFKIMTYYYGFFPTLFRHIGFIGRYARRRMAQGRGDRRATSDDNKDKKCIS